MAKDTKERILAAALDMFSQNGYAGTNIREPEKASEAMRQEKKLKEAVSAEDRRVLELAELPDGFDFDQTFSALVAWCQSTFLRVEQLANHE